MDRLKAMHTFVRIVEANSFSRAAETLNLPRASLTATLQNLEAFLGTRLLQRSTRRLSLTPDGADYFEQCVRILAEIERAEHSLRGQSVRSPQGRLRLDLPSGLGNHLILPRLPEFRRRYPDIELLITLGDRLVDLVQDGIDCALRIGHLQDSSLIGRRVGTLHFVTCAAPAYLAEHGAPASLEALGGHLAVSHFSGRTGRAIDWDFQIDGRVVALPMKSMVAVNNAEAYLNCGLSGLGMIQVARYQARAHLRSGALVELFPQWKPVPMPASLIYPDTRQASPKLRAFIDWLAELFGDDAEFALAP
ncbi:LysR family transcriptional regulator [Janthinobacterium sp.]|uniref:LysR family transcriptional regulator n=1 Tax=Janthinobacterium sp. TaxID=1871054 RepID=UPI00293D64FC|nr:LysR family transcriptional regulator [Janthinobacterium sp.]